VSKSFDVKAFEALSPQCVGKVCYAEIFGSTNDEAKSAIYSSLACSGSLFITEYQTQGRGRGEKSWLCPAGEGLLFSLIVDPDVRTELWYRMSLAVGVAIVEVCRSIGVEAELKWPNDVYVRGKKLGGILIEKINDFLVVGVGINVNVMNLPDKVYGSAISLAQVLGETVQRELLLSRIVADIYRYGSLIGGHFERVKELADYYFYLKGKRVSMLVNGKPMTASVLGLSDDGYLSVMQEGVTLEIIQASDIEILGE